MSDRFFLALMTASCVAMIGLAAVWPQGLGARSPGPFGHTPIQQTPEMQALMARAAAARDARRRAHAEAATAQLRRQLAAPSGLRPGE